MCCAEKYIFFGCWVKDPDKSGREQQNYLIRVKYGKLTDNLTNGINISVPEATGAIAFTKKPFDYQSEISKWIFDFYDG